MNREYLKWHSPALGRDMELLVFGHGGTPYLVFPTSMGRFFDYEGRGMIDAVHEKYERGEIQAFCVDSVDVESWYNKWVNPRERVLRHGRYERYLLDEVVPMIRQRNTAPLGVTGCSFGGFHSVNFAFRHPELTAHCVSMGGAFDTKQFLDGYYDEDCYYNCPMDFVAGASDAHQLDLFGRMRIVLGTGETDICLDENRRLSGILSSKGVPHWLDVWGDGTGHDWPWWQAMARKFLY
jgi:esterase/lipase superfamily enzyme